MSTEFIAHADLPKVNQGHSPGLVDLDLPAGDLRGGEQVLHVVHGGRRLRRHDCWQTVAHPT